MTTHPADEQTGRVLAVTLLLWGIAVAVATAEGVFERLAQAEFAALAIFASLYAPATYRIDRRLREYALSRTPRQMVIATAVLDAALAGALAAAAPWPLIALFGLPLAIVTHFALGERLWRARRPLKSARARSPGGSPAAT